MFKLSHRFNLTRRLSFLSLLLAGCSMVNTFVIERDSAPYVDSEFRSIVKLFHKEAAYRGFKLDNKNISIMFDLDDDEPGVVGACFLSIRRSYIKIKTETWPFLAAQEKEMLVFHELAHCLLGRQHCDQVVDGDPISLMNSNILNTDFYIKKRTELVNELFSKDKRCVESD